MEIIIKRRTMVFLLLLAVFNLFQCKINTQNENTKFTENEEYIAVEKAIHNVFGWAVNKDFDLFFSTISNDSNFISVTPYNRVKFGFNAVRKDSSFWGSPNFKALRHEVRNLKIQFSASGDVAWFYCMVDDFNEWKGEPANWENVRWTGVLEKRKGKWRVVQQHFSFASE